MNKLFTIICLMLLPVAIMEAQTVVVQDFEAGSSTPSPAFGATFQTENNIDTNGNSSATVGRYGRSGNFWYELIDFNTSTPYTVTAGDTKYLHVYVWYPAQPDISVRFNGGGNPDIRPTFVTDAANNSFEPRQWQDIVFPLVNTTGADLTVNVIRYLGDLGFQNPGGRILNNTDNVAYLDNFRFNDNPNQEEVIGEYVFDGTTWSPSAPEGNTTVLDNIIVTAGTATLTGDVTTGKLKISNGASLDLGSNTVTIVRDLNNDGTFLADDATLNFTGQTNQQVTGNAVTFENLTVDNDLGTDLLAPVNLEGVLALIDGDLTTNDNLTLKSTSMQSAVIAPVANGDIVGNVSIEQFYAARRAFRFLTSPVTTSTTIFENWQENGASTAGIGTHITGSSTGSNGFDQTVTGNASLFGFDNVNQTWTTITNTDVNTLTSGTPYRLFIRGSRAIDLTTNNATPDDTVLKVQGTIATGDITVADVATGAGEFSFIGNPYQAPVDMNQVLAASTNVNTGFYYVWDPQLGARGAYATINLPAGTNTSGSTANQYLRPGQAIFVSTVNTAPASMLFQESHKAIGENTASLSVATNTSSIVGQLYRVQNGMVENVVQDSFGIYFDGVNNSAVDMNDAPKLLNEDESISVQYGSDLLAIDNRQLPLNNETIQLNHSTYRVSNYQYKIEVSALLGKDVYLDDNYLGSTLLLNEGVNVYDFTIDSNNASIDSQRFKLRIENQTLGFDDQIQSDDIKLSSNPVKSDTVELVYSRISDSFNSEITIYNLSGQTLMKIQPTFVNGKAQLSGLNQLTTGTYFLSLNHRGVSKTIKFIKQ